MPTRDPAKQRQYSRRYYERHKADYLKRNALKRKRIAAWFAEYKASHPCTDCRHTYPACVMDFDHLPGSEKRHEPNQLVNRLSWQKLKAEIAKCELVCANCHRLRTHARRACTISRGVADLPTRRGSERGVKPRPEKQLSH